MAEKRLLYFALGVLSVVSIGAVTNQVAPATMTNGLAFDSAGITFPDGTVQTTAARADPRRAFYLTASTHNGAQTLSACTAGFHMASLWEILDVSNLRYATDAEGGNDVQRRDDSGVGPPSGTFGWIRTGYVTSNTITEGKGNCLAWTSTNVNHLGTVVELEETWDLATGTGDPSVVIAPWDSLDSVCSRSERVWCVED